MSIDQIYILCIAISVAASSALVGCFLILRGVALMSDAISHAILLGIVSVFLWVKNLHSPILILGAALAGVLTVSLTELIIKSKKIKADAAIGLVFPLFFSIGVILINQFAGSIHLDQDAVLLGELAFAPFNTWEWMGHSMGPISLWVMGVVLLLNMVFVGLFYKELKLSTFDAALSASLGFSPFLIHYLLMTLVSITAVGAFDAVGSILVVAFMITPPATAYLLTERLSGMLILSVMIGSLSALCGYGVAFVLDASIAGAMATVTGVFFILAFVFSPKQGLLMNYFLAKRQRLEFAVQMLVVHLLDHEGTELEAQENTVTNMITHMEWRPRFAASVTRQAISDTVLIREGDALKLTSLGRELARSAIAGS